MATEENMASSRTDDSTAVLETLSSVTRRADHLAAELEQLHRLAMLGVLSAGVAHEINNLLTPVIAYTQAALARDGDDAMRIKALQKALQGAETVAAIVSSTLSTATPSDNDPDARIRTCFERAVESLGRNPERDGIAIINEIPADLHVSITPVGLQQVFMNLVLNACNALRGRRGRIIVTAHDVDHRTEIVVVDNGPGIPDSIRDQIFEPFITADAARPAARSTGTGLGLAVCRMLIESAGGRINFESELDRGTSFIIDLPTAESSKKAA